MISDVFDDDYNFDALEELSSGSSSETNLDESESADEGFESKDELEGLSGNDAIENQIEGDFDRLIGEIREGGDSSSGMMLSRIWDAPLPENEEQFRDDLRAASGIGKNKGKGKKRNRRTGPALSHQVRALIGEGNTAYVDGNMEEAIRIMLEVIRIEPRALSSWSVLSTCFRDMDKPHEALQLAIMGAHLWHDADEWYELGKQSKGLGSYRQALYCFGKAARLDPENFNALWDRAALAKDINELQIARNSYLALLKRFPHNVTVLTELRHILIEWRELKLCAKLYQEAFDHYTAVFPFGKSESSALIDPTLTMTDEQLAASNGSAEDFTLMEILVLADLYNSMDSYEKTIKTIRSGCRWLQGRYKEKFWDTCIDDREYDPEGYSRGENDAELGDAVEMRPGHFPLDVNARHRLAVARLKIGDINEGQLHANVILAQNAADFSPLFAEIADAYFDLKMFSEARPIYEMLGADASTTSMHILMRAAACRRHLGDLRGASEVYEHIIATDPTNHDAKMNLAEILEINGQLRKALDLVYQVIDSRKRRPPSALSEEAHETDEDSSVPSLFVERKGKGSKPIAKPHHVLSKQEIKELEHQKEAETGHWYSRLQELWEPMLRQEIEAENEWLLTAEKLVEMFRETRKLFVARGNLPFRGALRNSRSAKSQEEEEDRMASRLELELEYESQVRVDKSEGKLDADHFRGIHFDDWLCLIMQYAFLLTRRGQFELADEVLRHTLFSAVYQSTSSQDTLRLAIITCALKERKYDLVLEQCRKLMIVRQFNNEPYRLFLALCASGLLQTDQFIHGTLQKHILRELRVAEAALKGNATWNSKNNRYTIASDKATDANDDLEGVADGEDSVAPALVNETSVILPRPTRSNPLLYTIYGQSCSAAKSFQSSIFYLLQAYETCKLDPMVCLSLSIASIGRAMQRQADNRNYLVSQAVGFLSQYRTLRGAGDSMPYADEIEYNYGRAFHHIGLLTHAAKHYQKALKIIEERQRASGNYEDYGVAREAAYNLSIIYVATGAISLSHTLYERWLSI